MTDGEIREVALTVMAASQLAAQAEQIKAQARAKVPPGDKMRLIMAIARLERAEVERAAGTMLRALAGAEPGELRTPGGS